MFGELEGNNIYITYINPQTDQDFTPIFKTYPYSKNRF